MSANSVEQQVPKEEVVNEQVVNEQNVNEEISEGKKEISHRDIPDLDLPFDYQNMETLSLEEAEMFEEALVCKTAGFRDGYNGIHDFIEIYMNKRDFPYKNDKSLLRFKKMLQNKTDKDKPYNPKEWYIAMNCYYNSAVWSYNEHFQELKTNSYQSLYMDVFNKPRQLHASRILIDTWPQISDIKCPDWLLDFNRSLVTNEEAISINNKPDPDLIVRGEMYQYFYKACVSVYLKKVIKFLEDQANFIDKMLGNLDDNINQDDENSDEEEYKVYESDPEEEEEEQEE